MRLSLRSGERLFVNGAVLRFERKASLEVLNDVHFLLENHVMQEEEATSANRRLYFTIQLMLIEPARAAIYAEAFEAALDRADLADIDREEVRARVANGRFHDAMKIVRAQFEARP